MGLTYNSDYVKEENRNLKSRMFFKNEEVGYTYSNSMSEDKDLFKEYKANCLNLLKFQPWYKKRYKDNPGKIDNKVRMQKFSCDGTFLREENTNRKVAYRSNDQGPFYVFEFLILYLSGVKVLYSLKKYEDLLVVAKYLELNRMAFRKDKKYKYEIYFEPVFQQISSIVKSVKKELKQEKRK